MNRKRSYLTFTDQFCGAGGSTEGAKRAGLEGRMALNHWKLAVSTHQTNHPEMPHECTDISASDPRRYPRTDLLITSPECTTHSPAGGSRRHIRRQADFFIPATADPSVERSRATMYDVVRFTELHKYEAIAVENVVEVLRWELFEEWLGMMHRLGYKHRIVCLNSMFCFPTPQSRDRVYIVFWRAKNRAPRLDFTPPAYCARCEKDIHGLQTWKNGRTVGKYRQQYVYTCPVCRSTVNPYYFAGLNAIDLSLPAERIADRERPLKPRTMERIRFGLEKYGRQSLLVTTNQTNRLGGRVRTVFDPGFTQPGCNVTGFLQPVCLVDTAQSHSNSRRTRELAEALPSVTTQQSAALVSLPFLTTAGSNASTSGGSDPIPTQTGTERFAAVIPPAAAIIKLRGGEASHLKNAKGLESPIDTLSSGGNHYLLVSGGALMRMQGGFRVEGLDSPVGSQVASCPVDALIHPSPFFTSYYGTAKASGVSEPVDAVTGVDRHAFVAPDDELRVEDCHFRMLQPHEIGAAMAFPGDYIVHGTKRDKVKQFGNAVTPPAMEWLIRRIAESLHPEIAA
ncbi:MAG: cytosine methyltransferase [Gemmatimonadales bacterium]|nr:cytosine methyltransferase [Gemmatimonadales bacterium]